jgi:hypothetical protein
VRTVPLLALLVALACAGCGGAANKGRTVTFAGAGSFPPSTIVGNYSARGCSEDVKALVDDARSYYVHSTSGPGPADLYYDDLRLDFARFEADGCTSKELGSGMERGLTPRQRAFLLRNVASDLLRAFQTALNS